MTSVYLNSLQSYFTPAHWTMVQLLLLLVQQHRLTCLEKLAQLWPQPIQMESRRRALQRLLLWPQWQQRLLWIPWIATILTQEFSAGQRLYLAIDPTQWRQNNLLVVSLIWRQRSLMLNWVSLGKRGSSNLQEQPAVLSPLLSLLASYEVVVLGDREFHGVEWASWLQAQGLKYVLRLIKTTYIKLGNQDWQMLE